MATPLTPDQFIAALRAEGLKVVEEPGWRTHTRTASGRPWGPVNGALLHHTVTPVGVDAVPICRNGYAGLPGPLCHAVIKRTGVVHLVGYGRCNHAGGGDPDVLSAVVSESYGTRPPVPDVGNSGGVDGNRRFYGAECENLGDNKAPWPTVQIDAMVRFSAAIVRAHRAKGDGWGPKSVLGHSEWSADKNDPRGPGFPGMPAMRDRVGTRLAHPASWDGKTVPAKPAPKPNTGGTKPVTTHYLSLSRSEDTQLLPGQEVAVYWTTEHSDAGQLHGDGGKTVLINGTYSAVVSLAFTGLDSGEAVEVYPMEEDASGNVLGRGFRVSVPGNGGTGAAPVAASVAINGAVGQRLVFAVRNTQETPVTLTEARLTMFGTPA